MSFVSVGCKKIEGKKRYFNSILTGISFAMLHSQNLIKTFFQHSQKVWKTKEPTSRYKPSIIQTKCEHFNLITALLIAM